MQVAPDDSRNGFRCHVSMQSTPTVLRQHLEQRFAVAHSATTDGLDDPAIRLLKQRLNRVIDRLRAVGQTARSEAHTKFDRLHDRLMFLTITGQLKKDGAYYKIGSKKLQYKRVRELMSKPK